MGTADHQHFRHAGVAEQDLLHLARVDVAAAADDHVFGAVAQSQEAASVKAADVPGLAASRLRWLSITPFGRLVVPRV